ncbi:hypothetical protein F4677DRAFT_464907 [Hypoxylon crocopeplum]|nr:hypothetical protein F4677DRAFT_464907 [Hypoxylon crocopeplum]
MTEDVVEKQLPELDAGQQVILLSIGGNDDELLNVLNQCIFQRGVVTKEQVAVAKVAAIYKKYSWAKTWDWDAIGRGCAGQLERTRQLVESDEFVKKIEAVLDLATEKLAADGMIYYTGYGKFFNEDYTGDCSTVSWSTWIYKTYNSFQPEQKLTYDHRRVMNELVDLVNEKLRLAAYRRADKVRFIEYDSHIGQWGGRFCEPGVDESTTESNTRPRLMFYELNTWDPLDLDPWKRSTNEDPGGTFAGNLDVLAEITKPVDPDAKFKEQAIDNIPAKIDTEVFESAALAEGDDPQEILLHQIIANSIIFEMINTNQQSLGQMEYPENLGVDSCPANPHYLAPLDGTPHCGQKLDAVPDYLFMSLANRYCEDHGDLTKTSNEPYTAADVGFSGHNGWRFDFSWTPGKATGMLNSQTRARTGILQLNDECGETFYTIVPPPKTKPPPPPPKPKGVPLQRFPTICKDEADYPDHGDIQEDLVQSTVDYICRSPTNGMIKKDDSSTFP